MLTGATGGHLSYAKVHAGPSRSSVLGLLDVWKKPDTTGPRGWASHDYLSSLGVVTFKPSHLSPFGGRSRWHIDHYSLARQAQPSNVFQFWPKTHRTHGEGPAHPVSNEPWVIYADGARGREAAGR